MNFFRKYEGNTLSTCQYENYLGQKSSFIDWHTIRSDQILFFPFITSCYPPLLYLHNMRSSFIFTCLRKINFGQCEFVSFRRSYNLQSFQNHTNIKGNCELNWPILYFHCCNISFYRRLKRRRNSVTVWIRCIANGKSFCRAFVPYRFVWHFLALKWAITDKFHDYLYGANFEVVTDNNPLTYVLTSAKLYASGHRWVAALANYNFSISYRSGKLNMDADGLSRLSEGSLSEHVVYSDVLKAVLNQCHEADSHKPLAACVAQHIVVPDVDIHDDAVNASALSSTDWDKGQAGDELISRVKTLVMKQRKPTRRMVTYEHPDVHKFLKDWNKLNIKDDVLYRSTTINGLDYNQLVAPKAVQDTILKVLHDDQGHQGRDRTAWLVNTRFFWLGMNHDIERKVRQCNRCILQKTRPIPAAELVNITSIAPMDIVCIDYLSLEMSKGGYENVLVITDHFTRYAQAFPTRNQTAQTTARILYDNFIVHYGFPCKLHSDKAQNFESKVIQHLCKARGIKKTRTTPYYPMGNGQVERFNQTLLRMLGTLDNSKKSDWKSYVPSLVHAYNATRHKTTGYSPFYLMFGRHPRLAIDAFLGIDQNQEKSSDRSEYAKKLHKRLDFAYKASSEEAKRQSQRYKAYYDQKVHENKLVVGDRVLVEKLGIKGKHKIADKWEAEYHAKRYKLVKIFKICFFTENVRKLS